MISSAWFAQSLTSIWYNLTNTWEQNIHTFGQKSITIRSHLCEHMSRRDARSLMRVYWMDPFSGSFLFHWKWSSDMNLYRFKSIEKPIRCVLLTHQPTTMIGYIYLVYKKSTKKVSCDVHVALYKIECRNTSMKKFNVEKKKRYSCD